MITIIETDGKIADRMPAWVNFDPYTHVGQALHCGAVADASSVLIDRRAASAIAVLDAFDHDRVALVVDTEDAEARELARLAGVHLVLAGDVEAWLSRPAN